MQFKRKVFSQNFLHSEELVASLIDLAHFEADDIVLDIGSGEGIIAKNLATRCKKVYAIEADFHLAKKLRVQFETFSNIEVHHADIRQFDLPQEKYCVFSNIPFHITADVIYKLLYYSHPPERAYIVMQREAAEKFCGMPSTTQFSVLAAPWFEMRILYRFKRADFYPPPHVDVVLLEIVKRKTPLVCPEKALDYKNFIQYAFAQWKRNLKKGLRHLFTYTQWKRLAHTHGFSIDATPSELTFDQWLGLFTFISSRENE